MDLSQTTAMVVEKAANADALGGSIKFAFNGGEGCVLIDAENNVSTDDADADCTINIDKDVFDAILSASVGKRIVAQVSK